MDMTCTLQPERMSTLKHLVVKIRFGSENSLLISEKWATISKVVALFTI